MILKKIKLSAFLLLSFAAIDLHAQEAISASGGNATGGGGSLSYTIGQPLYKINSGSTGTVAQGVQQPYEITAVTDIRDAVFITLHCAAYPNPTSDLLILDIKDNTKINLVFYLFDNNGKLLEQHQIESDETEIDMSRFSSGQYYLKVYTNEIEVKSFKIIKY